MNKKFIVLVWICLLLLMFFSYSDAYDNKITHRKLTEKAGPESILNFYLKMNLGFPKGNKEIINGKEVMKWLSDGSYAEDKTACRAANHMHNPLLPWDQSYMSDDFYGDASLIRTFCNSTGWPYTNRKSNVTWATGYLAPPPDGAKVPFTYSEVSSPYTWDRARDNYYKALTLTLKIQRDAYFAWALETLGHVLHLLQDVSVPAHTRNDFQSHLYKLNDIYFDRYQPYEKYVEINPDLVRNTDPGNNFPSFVNTRLTDFWDTDSYNGSNPSISNNIGLAEFSSANYLSNYTIPNNSPTSEHVFPYPYIRSSNTSGSSYQICEDYEADSTIKRKYISRKEKGTCPPLSGERTADHFALVSVMNAASAITNDNISNLDLWLDDNVHNTYAKELLSRAVGYSSALIDYFFRGSIEITVPSNGVYSLIADPAEAGNGFSQIKLMAKNTTPNNEAMTDGSIELVIKYRLAQGDPFHSDPVLVSSQFYYIVAPEANGVRSIPRNPPVQLTFNLSQTALPLYATDVYLQLVYHGKLGNEDDSVAVGFKDISEPTPIDLFNNMDKICLNGQWYDTGSPEAIAQVDANLDGIPEWDIYAHDLTNMYRRISADGSPVSASPTDYTFRADIVRSGSLYRAYTLSDYTLNHSDYVTVTKTTLSDTFTHAINIFQGLWPGAAIKNQVDYQVADQAECDTVGATAPCDIGYYPVFYRFRGQNIWGPAGVIIDNPQYPIDTSCSWDLLK